MYLALGRCDGHKHPVLGNCLKRRKVSVNELRELLEAEYRQLRLAVVEN